VLGPRGLINTKLSKELVPSLTKGAQKVPIFQIGQKLVFFPMKMQPKKGPEKRNKLFPVHSKGRSPFKNFGGETFDLKLKVLESFFRPKATEWQSVSLSSPFLQSGSPLTPMISN